MRWQRQGQFIPPFQFIPIAENNGQIHNLGHWAFRDVLRQALDWQALAEVDAGIVAVNVSSPEFARASFVDDVTQALKDIPIDPALIQIEITESLLLEDEAQAISRMQLLKSLGFTLAIDDFGTGYSSFSYLSRFPIDKLKIDRSFIVNMKNGRRDIAIVAAMINVAHQLGLKVIAEGVETEQERDILVDLNCDQIQGYLYGKPMSAAKATLFASTKH
jgi:EAL domain-containing protein (putative c-di-GMP-specific phosphodiesterase class I)